MREPGEWDDDGYAREQARQRRLRTDSFDANVGTITAIHAAWRRQDWPTMLRRATALLDRQVARRSQRHLLPAKLCQLYARIRMEEVSDPVAAIDLLRAEVLASIGERAPRPAQRQAWREAALQLPAMAVELGETPAASALMRLRDTIRKPWGVNWSPR